MALTTSLTGRVRNTSLPKSHALLPLLEAVVNGIQAIDTRFGDDAGQGRLSVRIHRSPQTELDFGAAGPGPVPLPPIAGFSIRDNGVGFTPADMTSFETLDSDYKSDIGCRGVGRLLWLVAFDKVSVRSAYVDRGGNLCGRHFNFSIERAVEPLSVSDDLDGFAECGALVRLDGFKERYQRSAPKSVDAIARAVFEHCIWYFLRPGGAPEVTIADDDEVVSLRKLMAESMLAQMPATTIEVKGRKFDMANVCLKSANRTLTPRLYWCAAKRVVSEDNLTGKVPGLYGRLKDESGAEFTYVCYLSSDFLDDHVRADRTAFDISEGTTGITLDDEITLEEIRSGVLDKVKEILAPSLAKACEEGKARVHDFVSTRAPRYRPVLSRMETLGVTVDPSIRDTDLELLLHTNLQKLEANALVEGQAMSAQAGALPLAEYKERLDRYIATVGEINQSDLAAYVGRRRAVLDVMAKLIRRDERGEYSREESIHDLLMPMRKDSNELGMEGSNLWILDERLAFHDYLASDKTLKSMPITGSESTKEPDILATRVVDAPVLTAEGETLPLSSIVVVEIKRPMRNDAAAHNPIQQCLEYANLVREGKVLTATGRPIPGSQEVPAFCYVIADLTPTMVSMCRLANLSRTHDGLGFYGFNESYKAYIEVISFDGLVNAAKQRNRAFFDKLNLPTD